MGEGEPLLSVTYFHHVTFRFTRDLAADLFLHA